MKPHLLLLFFVSLGVHANDNSIETAQRFCAKNQECIDILSMELDSSYQAGLKEGHKNTVNKLISSRRNKLSLFCEGSPVKDMCIAYKDLLLENYIKGLSER